MIRKTTTITSIAILIAALSVATTMTMVQADVTGDLVDIFVEPNATPPSALAVPVGVGDEYDGFVVDAGHPLTVDIDPSDDPHEVWVVMENGADSTNPITVTIDDIQWNGGPGAIGTFVCDENNGATSTALFDKDTLEITITPGAADVALDVHCKFQGFHGDVEKTLDAACNVPIKGTEATTCSFTLTYEGVRANIIDTVPAEWSVEDVDNDEQFCDASTKGNPTKSATKINCNDVTEVDTVVEVDTRVSPGKGHKKNQGIDVWKPTFCGVFNVNDGAQAILVDSNGDVVFSTLGTPVPIVLDSTEALTATSTDSGQFFCDGERKP